MEQELKTIVITLDEYKELLEIKGRYEELKEINKPIITYTGIRYNGEDINNKPIISPYKVTCDTDKKGLDF